MARKGQGISINVIVIAAIALLVLVIMSVLVIRSNSNIQTGTQCGGAAGGRCTPSYNSCSDMFGDGYSQDPTLPCPTQNGEKQICCVNR